MASVSENYGIGYDLTFELNEFEQPRIRSEIELVKNTLLFVLFSKPGQLPSLPTIGLNIGDYLYSHYDEIDTNDLKQQISDQCEALGVYFDTEIIGIKKMIYQNIPALLIHVEGQEVYPEDYMKDNITTVNRYLIGITYDALQQMIYNINADIT